MIETEVKLATLHCAACAMTFAIPARFMEDRRRDHVTFYCPAGHHNYYSGKSDVDKLKEQLADQQRQTKWWSDYSDRVIKERDTAKRQTAAVRGTVTRMKRRAAAGTCQCCHRSFANVARHMDKQHPGYVEQQRKGSRKLP